MTELVRTVRHPSRMSRVIANVYRTPNTELDRMNTYYFCCESCGNCGRRWTGPKPAREEAVRHVMEFHPMEEK